MNVKIDMDRNPEGVHEMTVKQKAKERSGRFVRVYLKNMPKTMVFIRDGANEDEVIRRFKEKIAQREERIMR